MKRNIWKMLLCALVLTAAVCTCSFACAEEEFAETIELELFIDGKFPEFQLVQTFATESLYDYIYTELTKLTESIPLRDYALDSASAKAYFSDVINSSPELFYVATTFTIYKTTSGTVTRVVPQYRFSADELPERIARFNAQAAEIAAYAAPADTDLGKLLRINDYFCANFIYDGDDPHYRPDELFDTNRGVCQSYMLGYAAVLDLLGIENTHATSDAMNHTWSMVYLDDEWYHVDVTWNDPVTDMALRACHTNFLLSDDGITSTGHHDWVSSAAAVSTKYDDFFWRDIFTPLACTGSSVYYLDPAIDNGMRTINRWNMESGSTSAVHEFSIVNSEGSYTYYDNYRPICTDGPHIYYASCGKLMVIPAAGGEPRQIFSTGNEAKRIHSLWRQGDDIYMLAGESPSSAEVLVFSVKALQMDQSLLRLKPGEEISLSAYLISDPDHAADVEWTSSDPQIASVDESGALSAIAPGTVEIIAEHAEGAQASGIIIVHDGNMLLLPADTQEIAANAFRNSAANEAVLPEGIETIGDFAFADCGALVVVNIPESVVSISETAFEGCENISLMGPEDSPWAEFAQSLDIRWLCVE